MASMIIELVKVVEHASLDAKKAVCCAVSGFRDPGMMTKFKEDPLIMKPQWFHSALAIYLLLTYPSMKPASSFIDLFIGKCDRELLKIAVDVLSSDVDGEELLTTSLDDTIVIDPSKNVSKTISVHT